MANVFDVASYILSTKGEMSAVKLQKLVYYSQAWSLAWDEAELFPDEIQAWAGGPVIPTLYERHRGRFLVNSSMFPPNPEHRLTAAQKDTVDNVLSFYGDRTAQWLSDLSHLEAPWLEARSRVHAEPGAFCREVITTAEMAEYYSGLMASEPTQAIA